MQRNTDPEASNYFHSTLGLKVVPFFARAINLIDHNTPIPRKKRPRPLDLSATIIVNRYVPTNSRSFPPTKISF